MDRSIAIKILDALKPAGDAFNALSDVSQQVTDDAEREALRGTIARAMAATLEIERFVVRQFPDLDRAD